MRAIAVFVEDVAGLAQRVLPLELGADHPDADRGAGLQAWIATGDPVGFGEGAGDDLGDRGRYCVDLAQLGERAVHRGEGLAAKGSRQAGGILLDAGRHRARLRRSQHELFLFRIPASDVDARDLFGRGDARPKLDQVVAEDQLQRIRVVLVVPGLGRPGGLDRPPEIELAVIHGQLVADLASPRLQEVPVGLVGLRDMVKGAAGGVDLADRQAGAVGHLAGDVGVGDILIGLRAPAAVKPVRNVIASQDGPALSRVVLRFQAGDLALD